MTDSRFQELFDLTSIVSLIFQISATALIATLSFVVSRAVRRRQMLYWAVGWSCYAAALVAVFLVSRVGSAGVVPLFAYYFLEYATVTFIFAGCRYTATDERPPRNFWAILIPAAIVAAALVRPPSDFFWTFAIHTAIIGVGWALCLVALWPALRRVGSGPGVRIVAAGLVLLALDYLHHLPTALYLLAHHLTLSPYYYTIISLVDGMFEFVLGFGTVIVIVDKVRSELQQANVRLKLAHDRTEDALHVDPLTSAFSRYSFTSTYGEGEADGEGHVANRGCVAVADLDDLKIVNDTHGHDAGDAAIRAVADGLRSIVRHEDRVYRWGGDEFVVMLIGIPIDLARRRFEALNDSINRCLDRSRSKLGRISASWGVAEFGGASSIKAAIAAADSAMYQAKAQRRALPGNALQER
jgi:diguanylate cyclase (GGDEF)-like protein